PGSGNAPASVGHALPSVAEQPVRVVAVVVADRDRSRVRLARLSVDDFVSGAVEDGNLPSRAAPADAHQLLLGPAIELQHAEAASRVSEQRPRHPLGVVNADEAVPFAATIELDCRSAPVDDVQPPGTQRPAGS